MRDPLLQVEDLTVKYRTRGGNITAVSNASFTIDSGEYFGLVGESGCGKSTTAKALLRGLDDNGMITSGRILYRGEELRDLSKKAFNKEIRWKEISWIPQSSMNSLNPLERIGTQAYDIANAHTDLTKEEALEKFREMLDVVGLSEKTISAYPHQLSGGMQQRVIIALALFLEPSIIVADEPTTALDVIMQDQIFSYLNKIKAGGDTSMVLITHDISVVLESCDSLAVMHGGQVAEVGTTTELFDSPRHPYTILLQRAFPDIRYPNRELESIEGHPPQLGDDIDFCTFADRCPWAIDGCEASEPPLEPVTDTPSDDDYSHTAACIRKDEVHDDLADGKTEQLNNPSDT